ncbi:BON domain-containing protein, partial [Burkholderia pseudomallei]
MDYIVQAVAARSRSSVERGRRAVVFAPAVEPVEPGEPGEPGAPVAARWSVVRQARRRGLSRR